MPSRTYWSAAWKLQPSPGHQLPITTMFFSALGRMPFFASESLSKYPPITANLKGPPFQVTATLMSWSVLLLGVSSAARPLLYWIAVWNPLIRGEL